MSFEREALQVSWHAISFVTDDYFPDSIGSMHAQMVCGPDDQAMKLICLPHNPHVPCHSPDSMVPMHCSNLWAENGCAGYLNHVVGKSESQLGKSGPASDGHLCE